MYFNTAHCKGTHIIHIIKLVSPYTRTTRVGRGTLQFNYK